MDWMWLIFFQPYFFIPPLANICQIALSNQTGMWESFLSSHQIFIVWSPCSHKSKLLHHTCEVHRPLPQAKCVHIFRRLNLQPSSQDIMLGLCTTKVRFFPSHLLAPLLQPAMCISQTISSVYTLWIFIIHWVSNGGVVWGSKNPSIAAPHISLMQDKSIFRYAIQFVWRAFEKNKLCSCCPSIGS